MTGFLEESTFKFMKALWELLLSAQKSVAGIPQSFLDAKKEEIRKQRVYELYRDSFIDSSVIIHRKKRQQSSRNEMNEGDRPFPIIPVQESVLEAEVGAEKGVVAETDIETDIGLDPVNGLGVDAMLQEIDTDVDEMTEIPEETDLEKDTEEVDVISLMCVVMTSIASKDIQEREENELIQERVENELIRERGENELIQERGEIVGKEPLTVAESVKILENAIEKRQFMELLKIQQPVLTKTVLKTSVCKHFSKFIDISLQRWIETTLSWPFPSFSFALAV